MDQVVVSYVYTLTKQKQKEIEKQPTNKSLVMPMLFSMDVHEDTRENGMVFYAMPCFFHHRDFVQHADLGKLIGTVPNTFSSIPYRRFGCTGLYRKNGEIYCGSWNGIYVIDDNSFKFKKFVSNQFTQDIHGLYVRDNGQIITMLASQDAVIVTNPDGTVASCFSVGPDLSICDVEVKDWRLYNKDRRGACGIWHFNYVQEFGSELWLTSRCINGFIIIDMETQKVRIKTLRLGEEALVHDGVKVDDVFYFTSIGGKIITANEHESGSMDTHVYQLTISESENKRRHPNWGRGIGVKGEWWYTTLDGRYGVMNKGFRLVRVRKLGRDENDGIQHRSLAVVGEGEDFESITGFDVLVK